MDFIYWAFVLYIIFLLVCVVIMFVGNSDVLTFFFSKFGKDPAVVYTDKVVWVTGASAGLGEGLAKELAKCSAKLVLSDRSRRKDELDRLKSACLVLNSNLEPSDILVLPFDMKEISSQEHALKKIMSHFGKLDVLVSSEGNSGNSNAEETHLNVDKKLFELSVFFLIHLNRLVLNHFLQKGGGQLAIVSSIAGKIGWPKRASYTGAKHALHGFFDGLRLETMRKNIDITMLCPGFISSPVLTSVVSTISPSGQTTGTGTGTSQGIRTNPCDKMTMDKVARLCLVAMGNRLKEAWVAPRPGVPLMYLKSYQPFLFNVLCSLCGDTFFDKYYGNHESAPAL